MEETIKVPTELLYELQSFFIDKMNASETTVNEIKTLNEWNGRITGALENYLNEQNSIAKSDVPYEDEEIIGEQNAATLY